MNKYFLYALVLFLQMPGSVSAQKIKLDWTPIGKAQWSEVIADQKFMNCVSVIQDEKKTCKLEKDKKTIFGTSQDQKSVEKSDAVKICTNAGGNLPTIVEFERDQKNPNFWQLAPSEKCYWSATIDQDPNYALLLCKGVKSSLKRSTENLVRCIKDVP